MLDGLIEGEEFSIVIFSKLKAGREEKAQDLITFKMSCFVGDVSMQKTKFVCLSSRSRGKKQSFDPSKQTGGPFGD